MVKLINVYHSDPLTVYTSTQTDPAHLGRVWASAVDGDRTGTNLTGIESRISNADIAIKNGDNRLFASNYGYWKGGKKVGSTKEVANYSKWKWWNTGQNTGRPCVQNLENLSQNFCFGQLRNKGDVDTCLGIHHDQPNSDGMVSGPPCSESAMSNYELRSSRKGQLQTWMNSTLYNACKSKGMTGQEIEKGSCFPGGINSIQSTGVYDCSLPGNKDKGWCIANYCNNAGNIKSKKCIDWCTDTSHNNDTGSIEGDLNPRPTSTQKTSICNTQLADVCKGYGQYKNQEVLPTPTISTIFGDKPLPGYISPEVCLGTKDGKSYARVCSGTSEYQKWSNVDGGLYNKGYNKCLNSDMDLVDCDYSQSSQQWSRDGAMWKNADSDRCLIKDTGVSQTTRMVRCWGFPNANWDNLTGESSTDDFCACYNAKHINGEPMGQLAKLIDSDCIDGMSRTGSGTDTPGRSLQFYYANPLTSLKNCVAKCAIDITDSTIIAGGAVNITNHCTNTCSSNAEEQVEEEIINEEAVDDGSCNTNADCQSGQVCGTGGFCEDEEVVEEEEGSCNTHSDCQTGQACTGGFCVLRPQSADAKLKRYLIIGGTAIGLFAMIGVAMIIGRMMGMSKTVLGIVGGISFLVAVAIIVVVVFATKPETYKHQRRVRPSSPIMKKPKKKENPLMTTWLDLRPTNAISKRPNFNRENIL